MIRLAPGAWRYALAPLLLAVPTLLVAPPVGLACVLLSVAVVAFFRDPERTPPARGVVAPADGRVSVVRTEGDRVRVGVFMNVTDVHVNRAPVAGTVDAVDHRPGAHRPAFSKESDRNERVDLSLGGADASPDGADASPDGADASPDGADASPDGADASPDGADASPDETEVSLIAGWFARRIHPYVSGGETVERGERIGHIAFGSRADVLLPASYSPDDVRVETGDRVWAGESVVARSRERET